MACLPAIFECRDRLIGRFIGWERHEAGGKELVVKVDVLSRLWIVKH